MEVADALADLLYVVYGCAIAYDIPLDACFRAVHKSNMTKEPSAREHDPAIGNKGKGANFVPVDLATVIKEQLRIRTKLNEGGKVMG